MAVQRPSTLQDYKRRVLRVLVHIQAHLDEELSLDELARIACFSPCHFHRIFHGMIGEPVKDHVRRLRLERAASRLKLESTPVLSIALDAGYNSHEAFTRSFRAAFGVSPKVYRKSKRTAATKDGVSEPSSGGQPPSNFRATPLNPKMNVKVLKRSPMRVAFVRHVGPYSQVSVTWEKLLTFLGKEGYLAGDLQFIGICHDDPEVTASDKIRYDACVRVDESFQPVEDIGAQVIAGGDYAMTTHFGPYHKLGVTYTRLLGEWLPRSGKELRGAPCFEVYLNDPHSTEPEDLITDIYAPLK